MRFKKFKREGDKMKNITLVRTAPFFLKPFNYVLRKDYLVGLLLSIVFGLSLPGCKRNAAQPIHATSSPPISVIKSTTGIVLPPSSILLTFSNEPRSNVSMWLIKLDGANAAKYPKEPRQLFVGSEAASQAGLFERMGHVSIKDPKACYFGVWEWERLQIHATEITTTADGSYVLIERFNDAVQKNPVSATNG